MKTVLLATTNPAKLQRLQELIGGLPLQPITPGDLGTLPRLEEAGRTHRETAEQKALAWSQVAPAMVMASDGGMIIPALGSRWNSLWTQRFAGPEADDRQRVEALLGLTRHFRGAERRISWVEGLAIAQGGALLASWEVQGARGYLAEDYAETNLTPGFWVTTLWYFPALRKRYSQLTERDLEEVNDHWHQLRQHVQRFFHERLSL